MDGESLVKSDLKVYSEKILGIFGSGLSVWVLQFPEPFQPYKSWAAEPGIVGGGAPFLFMIV